jgi:hypothetical protein
MRIRKYFFLPVVMLGCQNNALKVRVATVNTIDNAARFTNVRCGEAAVQHTRSVWTAALGR